jgi:hypothetical protein
MQSRKPRRWRAAKPHHVHIIALACIGLFATHVMFSVYLYPSILESGGNESGMSFVGGETTRLALKISSKNGFAYLLFYNMGYLELVKSFVCNLRVVDVTLLDSVIFIAGDTTSARALLAHDLSVQVFSQNFRIIEGVGCCGFPYFRVTLERLLVQNSLLQAGANIMVIEADAVWSSGSITNTIRHHLKTADFISADDSAGSRLISAGFLASKSTSEVRTLFKKYTNQYRDALMQYENTTGDVLLQGEQWLLTQLLEKDTSLKVSWLDSCDFACGKWYDDSDYRARCPRPTVIQNNYIKGVGTKVARAKRWGQWFVEDTGKCAPAEQIRFAQYPWLEYKECLECA